MYYYGDEVKQDGFKAFKYYKLAAKQENCDAQFNLAVMYENGLVIPQNLSLAKEWYKKIL